MRSAYLLPIIQPLLVSTLLFTPALLNAAERDEAFRINVLDAENDWPVPAVELRTTHQQRFLTDNAGVIAFDLPELMGQETWLFVEGEGYVVDPDGFGMRGVRVVPQPGMSHTIKVKRQFPGKRLGRLTGAGLFAESQRFGEHLDWQESGVLGCDSIQLALLNDRLLWTWGDTTIARYPLGLFHMTGATTSLRPLSKFEPPIQLPFDYFRDGQQKVRVIAEMPGSGPTWLGGYVRVKDLQGHSHLMATYEKIKPPLSVYEVGFCEWNDIEGRFEHHSTFWQQTAGSEKPPAFPTGHMVHWTDDKQQSWLLSGHGVPDLKLPATYEAFTNASRWQSLPGQTSVKTVDGAEIKIHRGSMAWNQAVGKWMFAFTQMGGKASLLGEVWMAVSDSPLGSFANAIQVASHDRYTFYNVMQHPELTLDHPNIVLFEGTYTNTFSGNQTFKPRHDYNQMLYRIDLDDPAFNAWRHKR